MADERTLGFSIEVKGTDTEIGQLQSMKSELTKLEKEFANYTNKSSVHAIALQTKIKALNSDINKQQKAIIDNAKSVNNAAGSYNDLVTRLRQTTTEWRALSKEERENLDIGKRLTQQKRELNDELKKLDASTGNYARNVGNYNNGIGQLKSGLTSLAGAFGVTFAANQVIDFGKESVRAFVEAEANAKRLEFAIRNIGGEGKGALDRLLEQSAELQDKGIFSDDDIQIAQTALVQYGLTSKQVEKLTPQILDLATAQGIDLASATDKVISAINGQTKGLKEAGIQFDDTGSKTENLAILTDRLTKFQGANADALEATEGKAKRLANAWDDIKESVGQFLVSSGTQLLDFFDLLSGKTTITEQGVSKFGELLDKGLEKENKEILKRASESAEQRLIAQKIVFDKIVEANKQFEKAKNATAKQAIVEYVETQNKLLNEIKNLENQRTEILDDNTKKGDDKAAERLEKQKKHNEKILKANQEYIRKIQDQQITLIRDDEAREKAAAILKHQREVESINNSIANAEVKHDALVSQEQVFQKEIDEITKKFEEKRLADNKRTNDAFIKQEADAEKQIFDAQQDLFAKQIQELLDKNEKEKQIRQQNTEAIISGAYQISSELSDLLFQNQQDQNDRQEEQLLTQLESRRETELIALEERLRSGQITEAQFRAEKLNIDKQFQAEELEIKRKAFEDEKRLKRQQIGIELALELARIAATAAANPTNATTFGGAGLAQYAIQAGIAIARSAIQYAAVDSAQFQRGGMLRGKSHAQGGIPFTVRGESGFEAEGGEAIINKRSMADPLLRSLASAINVAGGGVAFASGGKVPTPVVSNNGAASLSNILDFEPFARMIVNGINDKKVYQVESDVRGVLNRVSQIESDSSF